MEYKNVYESANRLIFKLKNIYFKVKNKKLKQKINYQIKKYQRIINMCLEKNLYEDSFFIKIKDDFFETLKLLIISEEKIKNMIDEAFTKEINQFKTYNLSNIEKYYLENLEKSKIDFKNVV